MACIRRLYAALTRYTWRVCPPRSSRGQALATAHLTIPKPQLLLAVPMKGLGARPAMAVHPQHAKHFPNDPIAHQSFTRLGRKTILPKQHDANRVAQRRKAHPFAEIPVATLARTHRFLVSNLTRHLLQFLFPSVKDPFAVELQGAHIVTLLGMKMAQYLGVREIAVKGEIARHVPRQDIVNQVEAQRGVILEVLGRTTVLFPEPSPRDRIMAARGTDIVGNQIVVGNDVALLAWSHNQPTSSMSLPL